ncbi:hypothetical protein [Leptospira alstonii]|uniref:hypothetical protein n=1 Tax=Leptospira alstonii TaxID=28452 RepID=UPI0007739FC2|nr:hypothetical protein [Leptospira alstonii]
MCILGHVRNILEILYFLSGTVLAVGVIVALRQYKLQKKDFEVKYTREKLNLTIDLISDFNRQVLKIFKEYKKGRSPNDSAFFLNSNVHFIDLKDQQLRDSCESYATTWKQADLLILDEVIIEINRIASPIIYNLASEELIQKSIGDYFYKVYVEILPYIFSLKDEDESKFKDSLALFNKWLISKREADNKKEKDEIDARKSQITLLENNAYGRPNFL